MIIWEAVVEEIALEGLDGITLASLWIRLQNRPDTDFVLDEAGKRWIWNFVRHRRDVFSFYQLPEPRPPIAAGSDEELTMADERTLYPIAVIATGPSWGSCSTLRTRTNVTDRILSEDAFASMAAVFEAFDADRFVAVASQSERTRVLMEPTREDFAAVFRDNAIGRQQYAMLERIGRSRYSGISAGTNDSLHTLFNVRAKDVFYILKRFETFGISKKQIASTPLHNGAKKLVTASLVMLARFSTPMDRSRYLAPMRKLIDFLDKKPDKRAPFTEVKELFGIATAVFVKKMLQAFPGIVCTTASRVEVPYVPSKKRGSGAGIPRPRKKRKTEAVGDGEQAAAAPVIDGDEEPTAPAAPTKKVVLREYQLIGRLHLDEDTGELLSSKAVTLDDPMDDNNEEDDQQQAGGSSSSIAAPPGIDWSRHNPYRTRAYEALRIIRQSGASGVDNTNIRTEIAQDRKQAERLLNNLKRGANAPFKVVLENNGRCRKTKYVWSNAEHQAEQYYRKFKELTNMDMSQFGDKERMMLGERNIQRMLFVLDFLEHTPVTIAYELLKPLRSREMGEGYSHMLDKKCLASLLKFLAAHGLLKTFITVLKEGPMNKTVEFICHTRIVLGDPEFQAKIASMQLEMAALNARRTSALSKSHDKRKSGSAHHKNLQNIAERVIAEEDRADQDDERVAADLIHELVEEEGTKVAKKKGRKKETTTKKLVRQGWWPHPAVQQQLQRRKGNNVDKSKRKRAPDTIDPIDEASLARRRKLRCSFSAKEKQMLLLLRAVSYVFYTGSRLWVDASVVRDLMHKYVPESLDKTAKALAQSSARDLGTNPQSGETMIVMAEQIEKHKAIKLIKKRLSTMPNGQQEKRWAFTKAFEVARRMFYTNKAEINYDDIDLTQIHQKYRVCVESTSKTLWPLEDVSNSMEIMENTAKRTVYSALALSRRDGPYAAQLCTIYKSFPDALLLRVIQRLRRNGMLVLRSRAMRYVANKPPASSSETNGGGEKGGDAKKSGDFMLSFFYRHFFYHHFHVNLSIEAKSLIDQSLSEPDEWRNVLTDMPGYSAALVALCSNKQVYFDLTVPSNVVVYKDNSITAASVPSSTPNTTTVEEAEEDGEYLRDMGSTEPSNDLFDDEEDRYTVDGDGEMVLRNDERFHADSPIATERSRFLKCEPGTEAVHLACQSANKSLLFKMRQERLNACESSDSRSLNVRVRDLTLNSCSLLAKLAPNYKDTRTADGARIRDAVGRLVRESMVDESVATLEDYVSRCRQDETQKSLWKMINDAGCMGITDEELRMKTDNNDEERMRSSLREMVDRGDVKICGVWKKRYVTRNNADPWTVSSIRLSKEDRSRAQQVVDPESMMDSLRGNPIKFQPRPWLKPDGALNRPMLRWLCEGIFLRVMSLPGVTEQYVQEQFLSVLDPWETCRLLEFLVHIGCLTRIERELNQRKPSLFGPPKLEKTRTISFEVPCDGLIKLSTAFDRTPMPEFVTTWMNGVDVSDRGAVFGRRRMVPHIPGHDTAAV